MKSLVNLLFCVSTWITAEAKQPLQPVIIDGHKFEWKAASLPAHDLSIGVVRSFLTNNFLYVSIADIASNSILNFKTQDNLTEVYLDAKTNSGVIYFNKASLRVPFFDNVLGVTSAVKGNNVEIRSPLAIFGEDILGRTLSINVAQETAQVQPELNLQKTEWEVGGFSKLDAIIQQENKGELHIRLMENEISPLSVVNSILNNDLQGAEMILKQIIDTDQPELRNWAWSVLVSLTRKKGDSQEYQRTLEQAVSHMERNPTLSQMQEKVRLQMNLKREPIGIIRAIGDLSAVNEQIQLQVGLLWVSVGNYIEAEKVFDRIIEEYPNTYQSRRARWQKEHYIERSQGDDRLYTAYQLVVQERWGEVANIYAQARKGQTPLLHQLVTMLHRHGVLYPVLDAYFKTIN